MDRDHRRHRAHLKAIARRAMIDRGLLPDFSDEVMAEVGESHPLLLKRILKFAI